MSCKAYESVSQFAAAYQLGATESGAAVNLLRNVPPSVKTRLTKLVRLCDVCVCDECCNHIFGFNLALVTFSEGF